MRTAVDAVFVALGVVTVLYTIGAIIAAAGDRPAVVRRGDNGMWTAARSYNGTREWRQRRSQVVPRR